MRDPEFKKQIDEENRQAFLAKKALEEPEPKFGIIIPLIPIGMPVRKYFDYCLERK